VIAKELEQTSPVENTSMIVLKSELP